MATAVNQSDLGAGLILAGSSSAFLYMARDLDHGSALAMGPGYFPRYVAGIGLLVGIALLIKALRGTDTPPPALRLRPLLLMLGSVSFFAQFVHLLGLAITAFCTIVIAGLADRHWRPLQLAATATLVALGVCILFVRLLGISLPIWPSF